jgi:hippurate hydrolase
LSNSGNQNQPLFPVSEELEQWMVGVRRHIHKHPETSYDEHRCSEFIKEQLQSLGIEFTGGYGGTGIAAHIGGCGTGGCVGLRADMDALPITEGTGLPFASEQHGIMHACGHDGHVAMLLGAAALLKNGPSLPGGVRLIFQPAEEHGNGAAQLIREGILDGVQAIFGGHIDTHYRTGMIIVDEGLICAFADPFTITLNGRGGHAARPHEGTDSIVAASSLVMIIQTLVSREVDPNKSEVITIGSFQAGNAHNIIAAQAVLKGTVRSTDEMTREKTIWGLKRVVQSISTMYDLRADIVFDQGLPAVINGPQATAIARRAAAQVVGEDGVTCQGYPSLGGEDFSFYQQYIEGCMVRFGAMLPGGAGPAHSATFDFDENCLKVGASWLAMAAYHWLDAYRR